MALIIILSILFAIGVVILIWLFVTKWSELRLLDPESIPEEKSKQLKYEILKQRIERTGSKYAQSAHKNIINPAGVELRDAFRRLAGKLTVAERRYKQEKSKIATQEGNTKIVDEMIEEAKKYIEDNVLDLAEKKLIEVISLDARKIEAYELLGRLYLQNKDFESARDTFEFINKLSPDDASVIASLGEVAQKLEEYKQAYRYFLNAVELSPKNPKYLDLLIGSTIAIGDVHEAMTILDRLIKVNPDNKKINEFERKIDDLRNQKA